VPPAVPPKSGGGGKTALIVGGVISLVVLLCCGLGIYAVVSYDSDDDPKTLPRTTPTITYAPPTGGPATTRGTDDTDDDISPGDCVVNDGTEDDAVLRKVPCGPGTYEVLSRIPFTSDGNRCQEDPIFGDPESDTYFTHDASADYADYVLCLKER
jgi:hypothetical protein